MLGFVLFLMLVKLYPLSVTLQKLVWVRPFAMHVTGPVCLDWCLRIKRFGKTHLLFHSFMILSVALAGFLPARSREMEVKMCDSYTVLLTTSKTFHLSLGRNQQDPCTTDLHLICFFPSCAFGLHIIILTLSASHQLKSLNPRFFLLCYCTAAK